ncbi:MAG: ATP-binding cassette domain-containing protein [Thermogemmatispora sp.]|uniref:ABC transporter ATP-binding protein n=1 Tax=Thermogemmatispora sp. TaxID=1968838 RepID=UPI00261AAB18|nr:ATP-binding cassette domain-containing protein [Thermogemmatispora sp.]MBX5457328.1 ATP-binding cassette domain-containing protein [Thermogemmatispora sp.]
MLTATFEADLASQPGRRPSSEQASRFHLQLTLHAEAGRTTVLLGESGAGKSTVLRLLAGLLRPARGQMILDGVCYFDGERDIFVPPQERPIGYVFQDYLLFPHLTVFENIAFGLRAQGLRGQEVRRRTEAAIEQMRLNGLAERRPAQLSGGQQQRVALARALVLQPRLLLLDEPLAALDVQTQREVRQELRRLLGKIGITTIFVTHNHLEALLFGDQILVLDNGQVIQQGSRRELLERPRSAYIAELVGLNFLRGQLVARETSALCTLAINGGSRPLLVSAVLDEGEVAHISDAQEACVVIDPRSITLYRTPPEGSARNIFSGEVVQILPLSAGHSPAHDGRVRVSIEIDPALPPLTAEITEESLQRLELHEGSPIYAGFKATEARAYL